MNGIGEMNNTLLRQSKLNSMPDSISDKDSSEHSYQKGRKQTISDKELLEMDALYCSHGDTVHYDKVPKNIMDKVLGNK